jgi:hypothetical protein
VGGTRVGTANIILCTLGLDERALAGLPDNNFLSCIGATIDVLLPPYLTRVNPFWSAEARLKLSLVCLG